MEGFIKIAAVVAFVVVVVVVVVEVVELRKTDAITPFVNQFKNEPVRRCLIPNAIFLHPKFERIKNVPCSLMMILIEHKFDSSDCP